MTIEVIKKGIKPEDRKVEGTCGNCKSEMRWVAKDGTHQSDQRDGDWNTVKCPVCGHTVIGHYND